MTSPENNKKSPPGADRDTQPKPDARKRPKKSSQPFPDTSDTSTGHASPAMVHDLSGFALIGLPPQLRSLLGDEALCRNALEIQSLVITAIVREIGVVVYVDLPVIVKEIERPGDAQTRSGMVLNDITAPALKKKTRTPHPPSPTDKRGGHA